MFRFSTPTVRTQDRLYRRFGRSLSGRPGCTRTRSTVLEWVSCPFWTGVVGWEREFDWHLALCRKFLFSCPSVNCFMCKGSVGLDRSRLSSVHPTRSGDEGGNRGSGPAHTWSGRMVRQPGPAPTTILFCLDLFWDLRRWSDPLLFRGSLKCSITVRDLVLRWTIRRVLLGGRREPDLWKRGKTMDKLQ